MHFQSESMHFQSQYMLSHPLSNLNYALFNPKLVSL